MTDLPRLCATGNELFLVCSPCEKNSEKDFGVKLASRSARGWYQHEIPTKQFDSWLQAHSKCGGRGHPDHFVLAHRFVKDSDQIKDKEVADA